ncbi:putative endocuticle structural glycoprotein ABD-4 [Penaeus vannamei]|uniref:Putative endocuticle structural glycoprotein ABD-4 n=1 Tax=Penaeus vannamei TaxID=6689 RepID=A0A423U9U9_PENVA|nr:putative endocuticle structural glycoprotein ABD-4 [Penaeus vannamei]
MSHPAQAGLLLLSVLVSEAAESPYSAPSPILKDDRTQDAYGGYSFDFESGNGIVRQESGKESDGQAKQGGWRYESPEGVPVEISFVADKGVQTPGGDHPRGSTPSLPEIRELRSFSLSESEGTLSGN